MTRAPLILLHSIASISVASGNAIDHLVHRHTHRVVRGSLLAVGRPDARLNALTSADSATCLSVNQACAIVNLKATCEAITIGHHANKLPMVESCLVLPTIRPKFLCELLLEADSDTPFVGMRTNLGGELKEERKSKSPKPSPLLPATRSSEPDPFALEPSSSNHDEVAAALAPEDRASRKTRKERLSSGGSSHDGHHHRRFSNTQNPMALMGKFNAMKHAVGDSELPSRLSHLSEEDEALKGAMEQVRENYAL